MSEWRTFAVSELIEARTLAIGDGYRAKNSELSTSGIPFARAGNIDNGFHFDGADCFPTENISQVGEKLSKAGDVIFTSKGTVGRFAFARKSTPRFVYSPQLCYWRSMNHEKIDPLFLFYWMQGGEFWAQASSVKGATDMADYVSLRDQRRMSITLPSLIKTQRAIAGILGSLDERIAINRQINQTLEHIAQAMFKSWFVDFEPVKAKMAAIEAGEDQHGINRAAMRAISGKTDAELDKLQGERFDQYQELRTTADLFPSAMQEQTPSEIPEGWKITALPQIIEINPTRQLKKGAIAPYLDMANVPTNSVRVENVVEREFGSGSKFINGDTLLARITPCLENGKTAFVDFLDADQVGWGSTEFIVLRPKQFLPNEFAYFLCRHPAFRDFAIANMAGTSGRQRVPNDCFQNYIFALPSKSIAEAFGRFAGKIMADIKALDMESRTLVTLRDILLPKLLSGELDVSALPKIGG